MKTVMPERFDEVSKWEQAQRAKGGPRATRSILKDRRNGETKSMTLEQLEEREDTSQIKMFPGDSFGCFCDY